MIERQASAPGRQIYPEVNRSLKGARLVPEIRPDFDSPEPTTEGPTHPALVAEDRATTDASPQTAQAAPVSEGPLRALAARACNKSSIGHGRYSAPQQQPAPEQAAAEPRPATDGAA